MPQTKQTARKTTGKHLRFVSALSLIQSRPIPAASQPKSKPRRAQPRSTATSSGLSSSRSKPSPTKSILKRPNVAVSPPPEPSDPISALRTAIPDVPLLAGGSSASGMAPASGALIRRRPAVEGLDMPISVCTEFATWLENQKYVDDETLLCAIERDGSHFLRLANATVMFDNALRGHVPPTVDDDVSPLIERARTLCVFAELLKSKISEGSLSKELETAVLREGVPLFRLAISCLEFDQAIRGSDPGASEVGR